MSSGLPGSSIVGLPDAAVQEARERVRVANSNSVCKFPTKKVIGATAWSENIRLAEVLYPPAGGGTWTAQAIVDTTGRRVDATYYTALREGRVYAPRA